MHDPLCDGVPGDRQHDADRPLLAADRPLREGAPPLRRAMRSAELSVILQGLQPLIDGKEPVMGTHAEALDAEAQRRLGADLFNKTWTLMEKTDRTPEEDDEMLHCAH